MTKSIVDSIKMAKLNSFFVKLYYWVLFYRDNLNFG